MPGADKLSIVFGVLWFFMGLLYPLCRVRNEPWDFNKEFCAFLRGGFYFYFSAVLTDNLVGDVKAKAGTFIAF